jgi:hypothetical protein
VSATNSSPWHRNYVESACEQLGMEPQDESTGKQYVVYVVHISMYDSLRRYPHTLYSTHCMLINSMHVFVVRRVGHIIGLILMGPPTSLWRLNNAPELPKTGEHMRDAPWLPI